MVDNKKFKRRKIVAVGNTVPGDRAVSVLSYKASVVVDAFVQGGLSLADVLQRACATL